MGVRDGAGDGEGGGTADGAGPTDDGTTAGPTVDGLPGGLTPIEEQLLAASGAWLPGQPPVGVRRRHAPALGAPSIEETVGVWEGLPPELWQRGRAGQVGERIAGRPTNAVARILAEDARRVTAAAVEAASRTAWDGLRYLAARVELLEGRAAGATSVVRTWRPWRRCRTSGRSRPRWDRGSAPPTPAGRSSTVTAGTAACWPPGRLGLRHRRRRTRCGDRVRTSEPAGRWLRRGRRHRRRDAAGPSPLRLSTTIGHSAIWRREPVGCGPERLHRPGRPGRQPGAAGRGRPGGRTRGDRGRPGHGRRRWDAGCTPPAGTSCGSPAAPRDLAAAAGAVGDRGARVDPSVDGTVHVVAGTRSS